LPFILAEADDLLDTFFMTANNAIEFLTDHNENYAAHFNLF